MLILMFLIVLAFAITFFSFTVISYCILSFTTPRLETFGKPGFSFLLALIVTICLFQGSYLFDESNFFLLGAVTGVCLGALRYKSSFNVLQHTSQAGSFQKNMLTGAVVLFKLLFHATAGCFAYLLFWYLIASAYMKEFFYPSFFQFLFK